jgi:hypothetical protein
MGKQYLLILFALQVKTHVSGMKCQKQIYRKAFLLVLLVVPHYMYYRPVGKFENPEGGGIVMWWA